MGSLYTQNLRCAEPAWGLPGKKSAASYVVRFLVKGTPESLGYLLYLRIVGKSEPLNTKNKDKSLDLFKLITAASSSLLKVCFQM
jgi:hypothetical protein